MVSKSNRRAKAKKAMQVAKANVTTRSSDATEQTSVYDISKKGTKCSEFSDATNYAKWTFFKNFELSQFATTQGALELLEHGTVGGSKLTKISVKQTKLEIYVKVLNVADEAEYMKDDGEYVKEVRAMFLSYPWAAYWLRDVEPDEEPGILDYSRVASPARPLGPGVFDKLLSLIPGLKDTSTRAREKMWPNVKLDYDEVTQDCYGHSDFATHRPKPSELTAIQIRKLVKKVCRAKVFYSKWTLAKLHDHMIAEKAVMDDPDDDLNEENWHLKHMLASHEKEVEKTFSQISKVYQQDTDFIAHHLKLASLVMNKIQGAARDLIAEELLEQDYHAAYVKLNLHFVTMGISGLVDQADRVRKLKLEPGMNLNTFVSNLRTGFIEWASVSKMREHAQGGGDLSTFQLDALEMQAQSGNMSDKEFKLKFACDPQIKEAERVTCLINGVRDSPRFAEASGQFKGMDTKLKTMKEILRVLGNFEAEESSQIILREENANKKQKINHDTSVNLTNRDNNPKNRKVFPAGSCRVHPTSTNHNNEMCHSQNGDRAPYNGPPCSFCTKDKGPGLGKTHGDATCRRNPEGAAYKLPWAKGPSAHTSMAEDEETKQAAANATLVSLLTANNKSLVKSFVTAMKKEGKTAKEDDSE